MWPEVIKFLGGATIFLAAAAWLTRSLLAHLLAKDIDKFKNDLRLKADRELATLRSNLEIENAKLQIKLSQLEARRILFIEELYSYFVKFSNEADVFLVEPIHGDKKELKIKADKFIDYFYEFYNYFEKHEIFVTSEIEDRIKSLYSSHFRAALGINYKEGDDLTRAIDEFKSGANDISESSLAIRRLLKNDFRKLIGVES